jgi:hypothetical protein
VAEGAALGGVLLEGGTRGSLDKHRVVVRHTARAWVLHSSLRHSRGHRPQGVACHKAHMVQVGVDLHRGLQGGPQGGKEGVVLSGDGAQQVQQVQIATQGSVRTAHQSRPMGKLGLAHMWCTEHAV